MKIKININEEYDHDGNMLDTYVVSDDGGDWDDEGELSIDAAKDAAEERADHYRAEGHTCKIVRD